MSFASCESNLFPSSSLLYWEIKAYRKLNTSKLRTRIQHPVSAELPSWYYSMSMCFFLISVPPHALTLECTNSLRLELQQKSPQKRQLRTRWIFFSCRTGHFFVNSQPQFWYLRGAECQAHKRWIGWKPKHLLQVLEFFLVPGSEAQSINF